MGEAIEIMVRPVARQMDLLLWRHAEAEARDDGEGDDLTRALTAHGMKQAKNVAAWLRDHRPKELRILASPATRTLQTAEALRLDYEISQQLDPSATVADLIAAAGWPTAGGAVLLVGHQPTLGRLASFLLVGTEIDLPIKKGALWWFTHDEREGNSETALKAVIPASLAC